MKFLFLDDDGQRHKRFKMNSIGYDVDYVCTYEAAIEHLSNNCYKAAFLDHDLSPEAAAGRPVPGEKVGVDVAQFIIELIPEKRPKGVVVHSFNDEGSREMLKRMRLARIKCYRKMFSDSLCPADGLIWDVGEMAKAIKSGKKT